jgi:hypothetical protein
MKTRIKHLYDYDFTDREWSDLWQQLYQNKIPMYEKTDGQHVDFTITPLKEIKYAWSDKESEFGGLNIAELKLKWKENQDFLDVLLWLNDILERSFGNITQKNIKTIFNDGDFFVKTELLNSNFINILAYKEKKVIIHDLLLPPSKIEAISEFVDNVNIFFDNKITSEGRFIGNLPKQEKIDTISQEIYFLDNCVGWNEIKNLDTIWDKFEFSTKKLMKNNDELLKNRIITKLEEFNQVEVEPKPFEGVVFKYKDEIFKITGNFSYFNQIINLSKRKKTKFLLIPGSFKPPHKGHLDMILSKRKDFDEIFVLISSKSRFHKDMEFDAESSKKTLEFYQKKFQIDNLTVKISEENSPFLEAIQFSNKILLDGDDVTVMWSSKDEKNNNAFHKDVKIIEYPVKYLYCQ